MGCNQGTPIATENGMRVSPKRDRCGHENYEYHSGDVSISDWLLSKGCDTNWLRYPNAPNSSSNYIYIPLPENEVIDNRMIIAYEPLSNHNGEGANVLFADGHSQFVSATRFNDLIRRRRADSP